MKRDLLDLAVDRAVVRRVEERAGQIGMEPAALVSGIVGAVLDSVVGSCRGPDHGSIGFDPGPFVVRWGAEAAECRVRRGRRWRKS